MKNVGDIGFWLTTALCIAAVVVLVSSVSLRGKGLLFGFLILSLLSYVGFYVPTLLLRNGVMTIDTYREFIEPASAVFTVLRVTGWALLLAFVVGLQSVQQTGGAILGRFPESSTEMNEQERLITGTAGGEPAAERPLDTVSRHRDPLYGVKGWLKFIVIGNLYLAPIFIGLQYIFAWIGFVHLAEDHPGIIVVGLLSTGVDGVLTYMGIQAARALRDIRARAVQGMKRLLRLRLGFGLLGAPLSVLGWSLSGLDPAAVIPDAVKGVVLGVIGFAIGFSYFSVSKRVKATYPDWNA